MKKYGFGFFLSKLSILLAVFSLLAIDNTSFAATKTSGRGTPVAGARKSITSTATTTTTTETTTPDVVETIVESVTGSTSDDDEDFVIENKSAMFGGSLAEKAVSSELSKNNLAEQIRKQREAIEARENAAAFETMQIQALATGQNPCDTGLRKCMQQKCGSDFSKCALDGDTMFGDKLNLCRKDLSCTGEEFRLFTTEIKADRDLNARLSSYTKVVDCGNNYN